MKPIALIALTAATLGFGTTAPADAAQARVGIHIGSDRPSHRYNGSRIGYDNGYRDGLREGNRDDRRNDRVKFRDERRYRAGDVGYRFEYGPRYEYVAAYRRGFEEGYRRGSDDLRDHPRYYRR